MRLREANIEDGPVGRVQGGNIVFLAIFPIAEDGRFILIPSQSRTESEGLGLVVAQEPPDFD